MRGEAPREAGRLGLGLALGFLAGVLSFAFNYDLMLPFKRDAEPMSFVFSLLGFFSLPWAMLLMGGLVLFFKWVEAGAATWLEVNLHTRSPRLAYRVGLTLASGSLTLWFGALLLTSLYSVFLFPPFSSSTDKVLEVPALFKEWLFGSASLLNLLGVIGLWSFPLAAWFWRGRIASAPISDWPFLEAPPPQLVLRPPLPLRPGLALMIGLAGGLIFIVLSPPLEVEKLVHHTRKGAFLSQIATDTLAQMGIAALAAGWIKRLGTLHALFAAFIASCVMAVGIVGLYSRRPIDPDFVYVIFYHTVYGGALFALPTALAVSAVAGWLRRSRLYEEPGSLK